jgi:hypothetical protein
MFIGLLNIFYILFHSNNTFLYVLPLKTLSAMKTFFDYKFSLSIKKASLLFIYIISDIQAYTNAFEKEVVYIDQEYFILLALFDCIDLALLKNDFTELADD